MEVVEIDYAQRWATVQIIDSDSGLFFLTSICLPEPFPEIKADVKSDWFVGAIKGFEREP